MKRNPHYVYIWGVGWHDVNYSLFSGVGSTLGRFFLIIFGILLVAIGVGVVESILPWLPWL